MDDYFLRSPRLGFRPWKLDDLPLAQALWRDHRVTRFIGGPFTDVQIRNRLENEIATEKSMKIQYWPIFLLQGNVHIGCCGLRPYRDTRDIFELGFHIRFEYWGKGYASESARAVIRYGFEHFPLQALFAGHHPDNAVSARLLQQLGFHQVKSEIYPPTGLPHPSYTLLQKESNL